MTREGGVGDRAGGLRRFATSVEAGGAGCGCKEYRDECDTRAQDDAVLPVS